MEKRAGTRSSTNAAKKIKVEHADDHEGSPQPLASQPGDMSIGDVSIDESFMATPASNLDRLANIAATSQRTDGAPDSPFLRTDTSLLQTPTAGQLSSALQERLEARTAGGAAPFDNLVDVMGFSGVDLRAEEAFIQQNDSVWEESGRAAAALMSSGGSLGNGLYLNVYPLSSMVHRIAKQYGLRVDAATLDYLSIATRMRFRSLLEAMVQASRHRAWSASQRPPPMADGQALYHEELLSNPVRQLAAVEKAERIEEGNWRRMRLEREEAEAAAAEAAAQAAAEGDDGSGKRPKRPSGTSDRNLSEGVRKRLADSTAMRHLGGNSVANKYAWLQSPGLGRSVPRKEREEEAPSNATPSSSTPANTGASNLPKPKFAPMTPISGPRRPAAFHTGAWSDVAMRQAAQREQERAAKARVTLHDALYALEREVAGGASRGSGRRALYVATMWNAGKAP
ncbi:hypothetical protein MCUN1_002140 [Malassezia cuniculi]|uniref:Transcription initiation factor TFIID subunit 4 n=1 Tax=Malassezia cuniculi TaxID=948313 RepID=A0AAF0EUC0_9BASI|nr:hypothetical protein MCUN1_002140 [Malassezia cuniculi]